MKPKTLWPIRNLRGRYSFDPGANAVWGHFEEDYMPVEDGVIRVKVHNEGQAASVFREYAEGTRSRLALPIDVIHAFDGTAYMNIGPLLSRGRIHKDRGFYEGDTDRERVGGEE